MPKFATILITGIFATGAITALSLAALQRDAGKLDRQRLAQIAKAQALDPVTTGSMIDRDHLGALYRKRDERMASKP